VETTQNERWDAPKFNAFGVIVIIPQAHRQAEIDQEELKALVEELYELQPWIQHGVASALAKSPKVSYEDNRDRFGPAFTIRFGPSRLLQASQLQAYQRHVLRLAEALKARNLPPVLDVYGGVEYFGTHVLMP